MFFAGFEIEVPFINGIGMLYKDDIEMLFVFECIRVRSLIL